jgi:hypothetical protein
VRLNRAPGWPYAASSSFRALFIAALGAEGLLRGRRRWGTRRSSCVPAGPRRPGGYLHPAPARARLRARVTAARRGSRQAQFVASPSQAVRRRRAPRCLSPARGCRSSSRRGRSES